MKIIDTLLSLAGGFHMTKSVEQIKRELEEEKRKQEAAAKLAGTGELPPMPAAPLTRMAASSDEASGATFKPTPNVSQKSWQKILEEYEKLYGHGADKNGALVFPTHDAAIQFFAAQAEAGNKFFATQCVNGQATDFHVYSFGNGQLYKGSYAEIKSQLKAAASEHPDNTSIAEGLSEFNQLMPAAPNHASRLRGEIDEHRRTTGEGEAAPVASRAPNPRRG